MDMNSISETATAIIRANFETMYVYIHRADAPRRRLHLLHISPVPSSSQAFRAVRRVAYESPYPVAHAYEHRDTTVIEDLQAGGTEGFIDSSHPLVTSGGRGYICVPLWYAETFEGTLSAIFTIPIVANGPEVQALVGCGTYLATALAHARLHAEVEQDRARLHIVLDTLPDGVLIAESSTGNITYANAMAAHILGVPAASLVGHPFQAHPQTIGLKQWRGHPTFPWNYAIIRAFCGETVNNLETVVTRPDDSHIFTLCSSTPLRTANGDITEAVLVFQDITERMSLEQHKNIFLSMASHELRTPVTAIQGFAELLQHVAAQGENLSDPFVLRAIENIVAQSEILSHLIEEMLDLSRIEQAYLSLSCASHDLIKMLTSLVETMASTSRRHHLRLVLDGRQASDQLPGWFDERRIMQVLSNLVSNAIKYSPAGGEIEVGLRWTHERPEEALLWVRDEGIGIAQAEIPLIFKRFYRVSTLDPSMSGLGIGLYLVKDLITRHGGRIWVKSVEGKGSTFFVVLPLSHESDKNLQTENEQPVQYNR
ncbi:MAG: ATP-binding protein [Ktedonobacteraceae bacterium]